jgi:hypothetical protein
MVVRVAQYSPLPTPVTLGAQLQISLPVPSGDTTGATDTAIINAALATVKAAGGGSVKAQPTSASNPYWITMVPSGFSGIWTGTQIPGNCHLQGAGKNATCFKLAASQTNAGSMAANTSLDGNNQDQHGSISHCTLDGNGANQTVLGGGIGWVRAQGYICDNVRVQNIFGNASSPPGETFHFSTTYGADHDYVSCDAIGTAGTQGSGFATNGSTNIKRVNCVADSMSAGMGFADYESVGIINTACFARRCGANGFNSEGCQIIYNGCIAGGAANTRDTSSFPFTAGASLGNATAGFCCNGADVPSYCQYNGCISSNNATGLIVLGGSTATWIGGKLTNNTGAGASLDYSSGASNNSYISPSTDMSGNTTCSLNITGGFGNLGGTANIYNLTSRTPAASGTTQDHTYPFDIMIYIAGGTVTAVTVGGVTLPVSSGSFRVGRGQTYGYTYSVAPTTEKWQRA